MGSNISTDNCTKRRTFRECTYEQCVYMTPCNNWYGCKHSPSLLSLSLSYTHMHTHTHTHTHTVHISILLSNIIHTCTHSWCAFALQLPMVTASDTALIVLYIAALPTRLIWGTPSPTHSSVSAVSIWTDAQEAIRGICCHMHM